MKKIVLATLVLCSLLVSTNNTFAKEIYSEPMYPNLFENPSHLEVVYGWALFTMNATSISSGKLLSTVQSVSKTVTKADLPNGFGMYNKMDGSHRSGLAYLDLDAALVSVGEVSFTTSKTEGTSSIGSVGKSTKFYGFIRNSSKSTIKGSVVFTGLSPY